ncbi:hypothetical protein [Pantoea ananatis]
MDMNELRMLMAAHDDTRVHIHPHYVKILRQLADEIESGKQTGIEGSFLMSHHEPGIIKYTITTKYNK